MTEQIKPCPFCGSQPTILTEENTACWYVECDCEAQGPHESTSEQAITAWNTRAAMQADAAPVVARVSTTNPVVDHETGNTSDKLRDAVEVWRDAQNTYWQKNNPNDYRNADTNAERGRVADQAAAAVIEAADHIEALEAENERLRLHLDIALETLAEEGVCGDECNTCKEARAALGDKTND